VILSFKHRGLERFFRQGSVKGIQPKHASRLRLQLGVLDAAKALSDISVPSWRLHALSGQLKGHYSLTVDEHWRLTFRFTELGVEVLNYQDYH
jgi:toxin HigB-1